MGFMTKKELSFYKDLCRMTQNDMIKYNGTRLRQIYGKDKVKAIGDCWIAEGNIPIVLLAHMDTVFPKPPTDFYYDEEQSVMWSPDGMGADDRAGIYAIWRIIDEGFRPHIVFTTDEEIGGIGSGKLAKYPCPFKDVKFLIQLDRRGMEDCVFYDCANKDFQKYIEDFGFVTAIGSFTDIVNLSEAWKVCSVNLSVGYENEHTHHEYLNFEYLFYTIRKVITILSQEEYPDFEWKEIEYSPYLGYNTLLPTQDVCAYCHRTLPMNEVEEFVVDKNTFIPICHDCAAKMPTLEICPLCGSYFIPETKANGTPEEVCKACQYEAEGGYYDGGCHYNF